MDEKPLDQVGNTLYKVSYWCGMSSVKAVRGMGKALVRGVCAACRGIARGSVFLFSKLYGYIARPLRICRVELRRLRSSMRRTSKRVDAVAKQGFSAVAREAFRALGAGDRRHAALLMRTAGVFATAVCVVALMVTVNFWNTRTYALSVHLGGKQIGYVEDELTLEQAQKALSDRVVRVDDSFTMEQPTYTLEAVDPKALISSDALCDKLIAASGTAVKQASGLYVEGHFVAALDDQKTIETKLEAKLAPYKKGADEEKVSFAKQVEIREGLYPVDSISDAKTLEDILNSRETKVSDYTIRKGDTIETIAAQYGTTAAAVAKTNGIDTESIIKDNEVLKVEHQVPYLSVKVTRSETYREEVAYSTKTVKDDSLSVGVKKTTKGQNGVNQVTADVTYVDGVEVSREVTNTTVLQDPVAQVERIGTKKASTSGYSYYDGDSYSGSASGSFIWPVGGGYVSSGYGGRRSHKGVDIAASRGTPIYAAASGRVISSGDRGDGYGYHIRIDHGNGYTTLYGHCSKLYVSAGSYVSQGQAIGAVGSTGRSTGNHCHFEVIYRGSYRNPMQFIG